MIKINFTETTMTENYVEKLIKAGFFRVHAPELVSGMHFYQAGNEVVVGM
jgi:hypothetical protein